MPSLIDLRRRIRSVKNTQQITKAMKMVAAAKLRRSQDKILQTRPYALELRKVIQNLAAAGSGGEAAHPLLETGAAAGEEKKVLLAVVTGDKGLCGSFNANVLRRAERERKALADVDLLLLGKRGADYYARRRASIRAAHRSLFSNVTYEAAQEIAADVIAAFTAGEYDAVYVVYNQFVSVLRQDLTAEKLLPVQPEQADDPGSGEVDYLFEPSAEEILGDLLPRFVTFQVYRVLLESQAAEHGARMTAMDAATKNAGELIDKLSLTYNRSRQAAITKELIEVVSGANALEG
ncbi:MAG TPA: ATP synthase F1 subunit gamma [Thermoanaerobaculia bacterium]|nr:ATP synthase F1 subunit gamma [Thermoanaerobaculia bacterium]